MKLILQLVVVPNAQTNFRDNLLKIQPQQGGISFGHLGRHAPFSTQLFPSRSPTVNKHARIIEIG